MFQTVYFSLLVWASVRRAGHCGGARTDQDSVWARESEHLRVMLVLPWGNLGIWEGFKDGGVRRLGAPVEWSGRF